MLEVEITPEGLRRLDRLPEKVRAAAPESILDPIADGPIVPASHSSAVEGIRSARRGDYRIIYEVFQNEHIVLIHRVQHRRDVYPGGGMSSL